MCHDKQSPAVLESDSKHLRIECASIEGDFVDAADSEPAVTSALMLVSKGNEPAIGATMSVLLTLNEARIWITSDGVRMPPLLSSHPAVVAFMCELAHRLSGAI